MRTRPRAYEYSLWSINTKQLSTTSGAMAMQATFPRGSATGALISIWEDLHKYCQNIQNLTGVIHSSNHKLEGNAMSPRASRCSHLDYGITPWTGPMEKLMHRQQLPNTLLIQPTSIVQLQLGNMRFLERQIPLLSAQCAPFAAWHTHCKWHQNIGNESWQQGAQIMREL